MCKIYLAIPYTGNGEESFKTANQVAGLLMKKGNIVYSPISQNHPIAKEIDLPTTWDYWEKFDKEFIEWCDILAIVQAPGWKESKGVTAETQIAKDLGKTIAHIPPEKFINKMT